MPTGLHCILVGGMDIIQARHKCNIWEGFKYEKVE